MRCVWPLLLLHGPPPSRQPAAHHRRSPQPKRLLQAVVRRTHSAQLAAGRWLLSGLSTHTHHTISRTSRALPCPANLSPRRSTFLAMAAPPASGYVPLDSSVEVSDNVDVSVEAADGGSDSTSQLSRSVSLRSVSTTSSRSNILESFDTHQIKERTKHIVVDWTHPPRAEVAKVHHLYRGPAYVVQRQLPPMILLAKVERILFKMVQFMEEGSDDLAVLKFQGDTLSDKITELRKAAAHIDNREEVRLFLRGGFDVYVFLSQRALQMCASPPKQLSPASVVVVERRSNLHGCPSTARTPSWTRAVGRLSTRRATE